MSKIQQVQRKYTTIKLKKRFYRIYIDDIKKLYKAKIKKTPSLPRYYESIDQFSQEVRNKIIRDLATSIQQ